MSALLLLPIVSWRGLAWHFTPAGWGLLLYLGLVPTALSYALYLRGLRTTAATVAALIALLEPLISTLLAVAILGERTQQVTHVYIGARGGFLQPDRFAASPAYDLLYTNGAAWVFALRSDPVAPWRRRARAYLSQRENR